MCDDCWGQGGVGGTRRCSRNTGIRRSSSSSDGDLDLRRDNRQFLRRSASRTAAGEEGRSVHQAVCGGIVAGVLFGGVLGGVVAGAAAVVVSRRSRHNGDDNGGVRVVVPCCPAAASASASASAAAAAAVATSVAGGVAGGFRSGGVTTREEAMVATGRAMSSMTTSTCGAATLVPVEQGGVGKDAGSGEEAPPLLSLSLPSAQPVASPVAIPCTSRSIARARRLSTVTATPASTNTVLFGVPVHCSDNASGDNSSNDTGRTIAVAAPAAGGLTPGVPRAAAAATATAAVAMSGLDREHTVSLGPRGDESGGYGSSSDNSPGGNGGGGGGGGGYGLNDIADTARRWWRNSAASIGVVAGTGGGGCDDHEDEARSEEEEEAQEAEEEDEAEEEQEQEQEQGQEREDGEEWWAGEDFEEEWACLFDAYCPEGGARRIPCLVAREPLQGSGVNVRVVRAILRMADWHDQGDLGPDEFSLAMYLCRRHRLGQRVPSMLEAWMIPPGLREARGCRGNYPSPAYAP